MMADSNAAATTRPLAIGDWLVMLIVGLVPLVTSQFHLLPTLSWEHHPFHAVVEGLGSFAALIVAAAMVMLSRQGKLPRAHLWVICALIGMGILDGFHAATHAGHVFVWLHSTATLVGGLLFACVWFPDRISRSLDVYFLAGLTAAAATLFAIVSIASPGLLPAMKGEQGFTVAAKALNVGGGVGFLAATAFFVFRQGRTKSSLLFANLSLLFGVAGIIFEQSVLWDGNWWLWHVLRLAAYAVALYVFLDIYYSTLLELQLAHGSLQNKIEERSRLFAAIRETVSRLSAASAEISAAMQQQSQGTETQASAVSRTASAVEEASHTAEASADMAKEVAESAQRAVKVGRSGRKAIEETRISMNTVGEQVEATAESILTFAERAQAIGEIVTAVNDIAEQTKLLALNAAIEAARAGEGGRGFAVVAEQVKSLAEQAKKATGQVRDILGEIQQATNKAVVTTEQGAKSVGEANSIVAEAEQTIDDLGKMVSEAAHAVSTIVASYSEQATSMSEITGSMSDIDQTAKQTLASTRQTERAAHDLNMLGNRLEELIGGDGRISDELSAARE